MKQANRKTISRSLLQWAPMTALLALSACGGTSQDPLKDHPLTRNSRPIERPEDLVYKPREKEIIYVDKPVAVDRPTYYEKKQPQNYVAANLFQINANRSVSFTAGYESQINFEIRILQGEVDYEAVLVDLPGAKFTEIASEGNKKTYQLSYKPALNMVFEKSSDREEKYGQLKVQLNVKSVRDKDPDKEKAVREAFGAVSRVKAFDYTIRRTSRAPEMQIVNFPSSINDGESKEFSIKVRAPGTFAGYEPNIYISADHKGLTNGSAESEEMNLIRVSKTKPRIEMVAESEWVFNYALDASKANRYRALANGKNLRLRAVAKVITPIPTTSDDKVIQYEVVFKNETVPVAAVPEKQGQ